MYMWKSGMTPEDTTKNPLQNWLKLLKIMIDGVYFMKIYNDLMSGEEYITFSEAREKYGIPCTYKTYQSAPGYNSKIIVEFKKSINEVVYKLRDKE